MNLKKLIAKRNVRGLVKFLSDSRQDWLDRSNAADALAEIGDQRAVEALIAVLDEPVLDEGQQALALRVVGCLAAFDGDARVADALVRCVRTPGHAAAGYAAEKLAGTGDRRAAPVLIAYVTGQRDLMDKGVASRVTRALGGLDSDEAIDPLIAALEDPSFPARDAAAEALGSLGRRGAIDSLTKYALVNPQIARKALEGMLSGPEIQQRFHTLHMDALQSVDPLEVRAAVKGLAREAKRGEDVPLDQMLSASADADAPAAAFDVIDLMRSHLKDDYFDSLLAVVTASHDPWKRLWERDRITYTNWLAQHQHSEWASRAYNFVDVRTRAITAIGELRDDRAVDALCGLLSDEWFRSEAAQALSQIGSANAEKALRAHTVLQ